MPLRRARLVVGIAICLLAAAGLAIAWYQRGPGFENEVARLADTLELRPGMSVAEVGAGQGRMAIAVAQRLGAAGRLYATEVDAALVEKIRAEAGRSKAANVEAILGTQQSTGLPEACCDAIYMRRVYHHFTDAAAMNKGLFAALRPGGRLAVIDFLAPGGRHGVARETVLAQVPQAGFRPERQWAKWSAIDYCLVFRKPL